MKNRFKVPESIEPYSGIIYFVVLLMLSHFFWKFTVIGNETETVVTFFGMNISAPFKVFAIAFNTVKPPRPESKSPTFKYFLIEILAKL